MKNLLIVYHSQSGNTKALASAVAEGVSQESEANIRLKTAFNAGLDDLLWAHGVLLGTPDRREAHRGRT